MGGGLCNNVKGLAHNELVSIVMIVSTGKTLFYMWAFLFISDHHHNDADRCVDVCDNYQE